MKKYAVLISLLMVFATCAFGLYPSLVLPAVQLTDDGTLTPDIDLDDYAFDIDGDPVTITGPVLPSPNYITVTMGAGNVVTVSDDGSAATATVGYSEDFEFTVSDGTDSEAESMTVTIVATASELDPDPLCGFDFDNDEEGWVGADTWPTYPATYGYDSTEKAFKATAPGNTGDEYYSQMQAPAGSAIGKDLIDGDIYEIVATFKGSDVDTNMPRFRFIAANNNVDASYETIVFANKIGVSPGTTEVEYTAYFIPTIGGMSSDTIIARADLIYFPGIIGPNSTGAKTLYTLDYQINNIGSVPATSTLTLVDEWTFDSDEEGWTTGTTGIRNRDPGTATFAVSGGSYGITADVVSGGNEGILATIQSPAISGITADTNYLVVAKMSGSNVSGEMPQVRILMANNNIDLDNEMVMFFGKQVLPDNTGTKDIQLVARPFTSADAFVRIDLIAASAFGAQFAGGRTLYVDSVAVYELGDL